MIDERIEDTENEAKGAEAEDLAAESEASLDEAETDDKSPAKRAPVVSPFEEQPESEPSPAKAAPRKTGARKALADAASAGGAEAAQSAVELAGEEGRNPKLRWYAVHTYSGHENKVRTNLLRRVAVEGLESRFGQVLVPTEEVTEMKQGRKTVTSRKYFPSYILVEMEMCDEAFHLVNQISGVTRFVGLDPKDQNRRPIPLRPNEVDRILGRIDRPTEHKVTEIPYRVGDHIRVTDGPFSTFNGVVDDVNTERGTLKVMVTIFGRDTPVELDFLQVEPL